MSDERRKHVIPGEVITSRPMRPEENVVFDGKNISSTIHWTISAVAVLPNLIYLEKPSLAAAISSIALSEPFDSHSSFFSVPDDLRTE